MVERPLAAIGLGLGGGLTNTLASLTAFPSFAPLRAPDLWALSVGLGSGFVLIAGSAALAVVPRHSLAIGLTMTIFALLGLFGYFGFVCLGPFLGILGGFFAITWPTPEAPAGSAGSFALAMASAFFVQVGVAFGALAPYPFQPSPDIELVIGLVAATLIVIGGAILYLRPWENLAWGSMVIVAASFSFFGAYRGFVLGGLLGIAAGTLGMVRADAVMQRWHTWKPKR